MPYLDVIDRNGESSRLSAREGDTVMEVLRDAGLPIEAVCGGCCVCATCHVYIDPAWVPRLESPKRGEVALLEGCRHYKSATSRLGCQISLRAEDDGLALRLAPEE
jgi:2Fe-2S ferredoxin